MELIKARFGHSGPKRPYFILHRWETGNGNPWIDWNIRIHCIQAQNNFGPKMEQLQCDLGKQNGARRAAWLGVLHWWQRQYHQGPDWYPANGWTRLESCKYPLVLACLVVRLAPVMQAMFVSLSISLSQPVSNDAKISMKPGSSDTDFIHVLHS